MMDSVKERLLRWFKPYAALWIIMMIGGALVVVLAIGGAEVYEGVVDEDGLTALDIPALQYAQQLRTPELNAAVTAFTNIGGGVGMPILASLLTAWLCYLSRTFRPLILVASAAAVSITATSVGKTLVGRARPEFAEAVPPFETSPSFPSGHTLNTTVVIGVLVYVMCLQFVRLWARITAITLGTLFIVAMGLSRVFLGHHWLTDVVAAWLLGLAWMGFVILAHQLFLLLMRRDHGGRAPSFDRPAVSDVIGRNSHDADSPGGPARQ